MTPEGYVTIKVLFFARAREYTGQKEVNIEVPNKIQGKELLEQIVKRFKLDALKCNVILALNETWIDLNSELSLKNEDEIAVIPPLSGGNIFGILTLLRTKPKKLISIFSKDKCWLKEMNWVKLTSEKLSVESIFQMVCSPEFGAVSVFVGTTRNNFQGKTVTKLEYEAYEGMAVKSLENICQNIRQRYDVGNIAIFHRLGDVPIEEASVVIAISSAHRKPALEAVPYAIDALKADVPIWKKEVYEEGKGAEWKENAECGWSSSHLNNSN